MGRTLLRADGLRPALRDLRKVAPEAADEVLDVLGERADQVADLARPGAAPAGPRRARKRGRGRPGQTLGQSLKGKRTARGGAIESRKPYGNIQEEGGSTPSARSASTRGKAHLTGKHFLRDVLEMQDPRIAEDLENEVAHIFRRHGFEL